MSYANDFMGKLEDTARAYLRTSKGSGNLAAFTSSQILSGEDDADLELPRIVLVCDACERSEAYDGNWKGPLEVRVIASAQDTDREDFRDMCGEVAAHFLQSKEDMLVNLSNATIEFTAQQVIARSQNKRRLGDADSAQRIWTMTLEIDGCGSVVG